MLDKKSKGKDRFERFLNLFFADKSVKQQFTRMMVDSQLLIHRSHELDKLANDAKLLKAQIEAHDERVRWQLHRIYRARNLIVHSGTSPVVLPQLTENGISYYKSLMSVLVDADEKFRVSDSDALFDLCVSVSHTRREKLEEMRTSGPQDFLMAAVSSLF